MHDYVVILDAGSQFGKVIDRKVRELHVETKILPLDTPTATLRDDENIKAVIISGGPSSVYGDDAPKFNADLFTELGKPILGICYGMQLMTLVLGGTIERKAVREDGQDCVDCDTTCPLFAGMDAKQLVLLTHGDSVGSCGDQFKTVAVSPSGIVAAVAHRERLLFGVQFHPEVDLTVNGVAIFKNFLTVAKCSFGFTMADRETTAINHIRERTSDGQNVLCLVSGGVDSTVCAALLLKALGPERLICIHIDHGFMREGESAAVVEALSVIGVVVHRIDAAEDFANATTEVPAKGSREAYITRKLKDCVSPEDKRHIIGNTFMKVCDNVTASMNLDVDKLLLAQGTLRPDLIESGSHLASSKADAIKTHHNDTELVRIWLTQSKRITMTLSLCEFCGAVGGLLNRCLSTIRMKCVSLVETLGCLMRLSCVNLFLALALAIRTLCTEAPAVGAPFEATESFLRKLEESSADSNATTTTTDRILAQAATIVRELDLALAVLPIQTVGVQGDGRTYSNAVVLSSKNGGGADHRNASTTPWTTEEWSQLLHLARLIPQVAHHVNRVVFAFGAPIGTSPRTVTPTTLQLDTLERIRSADHIVGRYISEFHLVKKLSQVPVVLIPLGFEKGDTAHSVVIRTFLTNDFMTGKPATPGSEFLPHEALAAMVAGVQQLTFVGRVLFDLTAKPPGCETSRNDRMGMIEIFFPRRTTMEK
ncbi:GMP synthase, putative [Bodo saltans]|uniref:GMP synthase (glutamine-hydrolyzing) n=1 Tax=Bodo saltans TaxID=75058 RepID=A0A0S4JFT1_BODSA|nr:GMP synthase, putative [Bodo saltans]|eukprot:CUG90419.1 GMP synthase, putative [Bodo saltans]